MICVQCGKEFRLQRYHKRPVKEGYCCSDKCWNEWWNNYLDPNHTSNRIICKNCGCESVRKYGDYCSRSCSTTANNKKVLKEGNSAFQRPGFQSQASRLAIEQGKHPFLKGNMSEESLKLKAQGISAARSKEAELGIHPWQNPKNFIDNEYSRSKTMIEKRSIKNIIIYIADCAKEGFFKVGWTEDILMRQHDNRTMTLSNIKGVRKLDALLGIKLERDLKHKFFNPEDYVRTHSTELFPLESKDSIIEFINNY